MIRTRLRNRIRRPEALCGFVACLLLPFIWNALLPNYEAHEIHFALTDNPLRVATQREIITRKVELLDEGRRQAILLRIEWRTFQIDLDLGGKYSVFGVSRPTLSGALELKVNGRLVSTLAFYEGSTPGEEGSSVHRIATDVSFRSGSNRIHLEGTSVLDRTLTLVLRRELPPTPLRYAILFAGAFGLLALCLCVPVPAAKTSSARVAVTVGAFAVFAVGVPALTVAFMGEGLSNLGVLNPHLKTALDAFEETLVSEEHRGNTEREFNIAVFGDSTHFMNLAPEEEMVPALERALPTALQDKTYVYGMASGAFSAFDYYFLLNRIEAEEPDLVILPVNQRWFSDRRMYAAEILDFHELEGYAPFSEYPKLLLLKVGDREFNLLRLLLHHANRPLLNRLVTASTGSLVWTERRTDYMERSLRELLPLSYPPIRLVHRHQAGPRYSTWNDAITETHDFFKMYRLINRLAKKHEIALLYYSVNQNVQAQLEQQNDLKLAENTALIKRVITDDDHIYFLDLAASNPPEMFSDANDHLTPEGISTVARRLAEAALQILGVDGNSEPVPGLEQGPM